MTILALLLPVLLSGALYAALQTGALQALTRRPIAVVGVALAIGSLWKLLNLPLPPDTWVRVLAQAMLGALVFSAALECRLSKLPVISSDALRLAVGGSMLMMLGIAATAFVFVPGLGLYPPVLIGAALMLGGAPVLAGNLLTAPIDESTRVAARVEAAAVLTVGVPLAVMLGAGARPATSFDGIMGWASVEALLGFALGGVIGLVGGRFLRIGDQLLPPGPLFLAAGTYAAAVLLGLNPVMAMAAAGLTLSQSISVNAQTRSRYWRTTEFFVIPPALILFGLFLAPLAVTFDFLVWFMAIVAVVIIRALARHLILSTSHLPLADRTFLIWFNGAPGVASGLMLLVYVFGQAPIDERLAGLGAGAILIGIISTRIMSKPLTRRLVQQTALSRKQRYETSYSMFQKAAE